MVPLRMHEGLEQSLAGTAALVGRMLSEAFGGIFIIAFSDSECDAA